MTNSEIQALMETVEYKDFWDATWLPEEAVFAGLSIDIPLDELEDSYIGEFYSYTEIAKMYVDDGRLGDIPDKVAPYIDYSRVGRDLSMKMCDYDGYYFRT